MDNKEKNDELQEFDLDDILNEFHSEPEEEAETDDQLNEELSELLGEMPQADAEEPEQPEEAEPSEEAEQPEEAEQLPEQDEEDPGEEEETEVPEDKTIRIDSLAEEEAKIPEPIVFDPRAKLRALKRQLIAGPEKRYYELSEQGVGRLQAAILLNLIIVALCIGGTVLYAMNLVPENRMKLLIFSQVLAMMISALLGTHLMIDGTAELFRGRFSVNTLLTLTFLACCVDAAFCLKSLRVPCCAAFSLEMTFALWGRYQRRSAEMGQMDTLRKAVKLRSLVKSPDFYQGEDGLLRGEGKLEDFWDNYEKSTVPEKIQGFYAFISFLLCIAIAVLAGLLHGADLAVQTLSTSLLVAVPASFFVALTRPVSILERRLHMVGTVLCGWQGVRKLSGRAVFPLTDQDLFPKGSTKLNGVKFYSDRTPDQIVSYTSSLIFAAGGSLVPVFRQLATNRGVAEHPVVNLQRYAGGGVGGEVCGEPVLLGNSTFLQEMGVEIPEGNMVSQAVYAAIDGELCAVVAISYAKMRSASAGIVTLCGYRKLTCVLTGADFVLSESFLRGKFGINTKRMQFPDPETRKALAAVRPDENAVAMALTTRDELISSAYAVTGARSLRTASAWGLVLHMAGGILGMVIMAVLAYLGSAELLTPANVLLYQLVWMVPGLLITEWTRNV